jgi:hypothetical protein
VIGLRLILVGVNRPMRRVAKSRRSSERAAELGVVAAVDDRARRGRVESISLQQRVRCEP